MSQEREITVTPEQLTEGYIEKVGPDVYERSFQVIRILPSGNYVVVRPTFSVPDGDLKQGG